MKIDLNGIKKIDKEVGRCEDMLEKLQNGKKGTSTHDRHNSLMARIQGLMYAKRMLVVDD